MRDKYRYFRRLQLSMLYTAIVLSFGSFLNMFLFSFCVFHHLKRFLLASQHTLLHKRNHFASYAFAHVLSSVGAVPYSYGMCVADWKYDLSYTCMRSLDPNTTHTQTTKACTQLNGYAYRRSIHENKILNSCFCLSSTVLRLSLSWIVHRIGSFKKSSTYTTLLSSFWCFFVSPFFLFVINNKQFFCFCWTGIIVQAKRKYLRKT